jgi:hypothetical protein
VKKLKTVEGKKIFLTHPKEEENEKKKLHSIDGS